MVHQCLLNRMQTIRRQILYGDQLFTVQCRQQQNAGIESLVANGITMNLTNNYRAGATIAFGATFLGARSVRLVTQPIQYGGLRIKVFDFNRLITQKKPNTCCHQLPR